MRLRDVILRGTRALQPAAAATDVGVLYCVTDEADIVERCNGTTWDAYSPTAGGGGGGAVMTGDTGAGGVQGLVPAPAAGTAAAGKYLKADGTWAVPPDTNTVAPAMTGDAGAGGAAGLVPAPPAGSAAAGKYLKADGTWAVPPDLTGGGGSGLDQLTGDVLAGPGTGSQAATIAARAVSFAKLQAVATARILGRATGGAGDVEELTGLGVNLLLDPFTGDVGSGAVKGLVPAAAAGTAAAGKYLKADGTWAVPPGSGGSITRVAGITVDSGGTVMAIGLKGIVRVPWAGTITKVTLLAATVGSLVVDIWKDTYANYPPTVADTITASAKPTLAGAAKYESTALTGWTTTVAAGDVLAFNVDSVLAITRFTLELEVLT